MTKLIINADDFGMSKIFNEKILDLLKKQYIKSTSVLVNRITKNQNRQIKELIKLQKNKKISIGLHLEIDIKKPLKTQMEKQLKKFISIFRFTPSHLDIHKLIHSKKVIRIANQFAQKHKLPIRNHGIKAKTKQTDYPAFSITHLKMNEVYAQLKKMKDKKSYEIISHPGTYDKNCQSSLNKLREKDYKKIIKIHNFLKQNKKIKIISYLKL